MELKEETNYDKTLSAKKKNRKKLEGKLSNCISKWKRKQTENEIWKICRNLSYNDLICIGLYFRAKMM